MPDILIQCPECSREFKISEYATLENMKCATCGAILSRPESAQRTREPSLRLKRGGRPPRLPGVAPTLPDVPDALAIAGGPVVYAAPMVDVHQTEEIRDAPRWVSWAVALLVVGTLIGFQYFSQRLESYLAYYMWARSGLALAAYAMVVVLAFKDHVGPGLICLFLPPYALVYSASSVESGLLRGILYGMVIVLIAEVYFLPEHAALLAAADLVDRMIDNVDGLIIKASESPI